MKTNAFDQIESARTCVGRVGSQLREMRARILESAWFREELRQDLDGLLDKFKVADENLRRPCLKIAFVGTTSSGKSTLLNALAGHKIAPIDAGEMSAGVVRIRDGERLSMTVQPTEGMAWKSGAYKVNSDDDIYKAMRDEKTGIMELYRQAEKKDENVMAPEIEITSKLAPKHGGILQFTMPTGIDLEFYDLPGVKSVTDARNVGVIQKHLAGSFLLIVLNYNETDGEKLKTLLSEVKRTVESFCRNREALLFVLNRVDERNSAVDNPLEDRLASLQKNIQEILAMPEAPVIIPMSAHALFLLQTAWGAELEPQYKYEDCKQKSRKQIEFFFVDCAKIIREIGKTDPDKKAWFKDHDEDNIDKWGSDDVPVLLHWVYEYSGAYKFWEAMQKKLNEQIGPIIINPALEGTPALLEDFRRKLEEVISVLRINSTEEIQREKDRITQLTADIRGELSSFKDRFLDEFRKSVEAIKSGNAASIEATRFSRVKDCMGEISEDIHDNIMMPIRNALIANDVDKLEELETCLAKVVPALLASNIKRAATNLLLKGYGDYAKNGNHFECRLDKRYKHEEEITRLEEIEKRRMALAGYVDNALLARSKLLLQEKLGLFQEITDGMIDDSMQKLARELGQKVAGFDAAGAFAKVEVRKHTIDLPGNVFSKITIEEAGRVMTKKVWEKV